MKFELKDIIETPQQFLSFLKTRTALFHLSNVFFRDFQYGIMAYGESKGKKIRYDNAEALAKDVVVVLEREGILKPIKPGSWMVVYPDFKKPSTKPEGTAKPSSGPAVAKTATATSSSGLVSSASSGTIAAPSNS
jgi:hypothetical protein